MKKLIFGLCCAALAAPLAAQDPGKPASAPATAVQTVSHRACDTACPKACPQACPENLCVSEPTTKKTTKVVYSSKCIEYCLPKCSLLGGGRNSCEQNCGHVRTKNVLMKRVVTEECPDTHCVVRPAGCLTMPPASERVSAPATKSSGKE